jgi:hypothetical protein
MRQLVRGQASDCRNPVLVLLTIAPGPPESIAAGLPPDVSQGQLVDPAWAEYQVFDVSTPAKRIAPVQVFPAPAGSWQSIDLAPCPAGDRLGQGRFVARFTPAVDAVAGAYKVCWRWQLADPIAVREATTPFEVLADPAEAVGAGYCSIADLRDEGVTDRDASLDRLVTLVAMATRYIEEVTERFFEARYQSFRLDGKDSEDLLLPEPVIAVEQVRIVSPWIVGGVWYPGAINVYNRHLSMGLVKPDDRDDPRISLVRIAVPPTLRPGFLSDLIFPRGTQNVEVKGVFGYTDVDGSTTGGTPRLLREVCKRLVVRELPRLRDVDAREDAQKRYRLTQERTRDQGYTLEALKLHGVFTGDPEIDGLLVMFKRPGDLGAA